MRYAQYKRLKRAVKMVKEDKLSDIIGTLQRFSSDIFSDAIQRKLILDNLSEGVFTVDLDLKITSLNKSAENIIGISEEEALGEVCSGILPSALSEEFCIVKQVLEEGNPLLKRTRHLKIGDKNVPVLVSASPLEDSNGKTVGGVQSFQEISEIFHNQLILDNFFDAVFTVDTDYKITSFNRAAEMLTGFIQNQVIGKVFSTVLSAGKMGLPDEKMPLVQAMKTGKAAISETASLKTSDQQTLPVSIRAVPLLDPRGDLIGGVESFRDNTGAIQSRHILDSVADGVFTVDTDFRITSFNRSAEKITGYPTKEVIGRKCRDIFCGSVCGTACPVAKAQKTQSDVLASDVIIQGKMGKQIPVSISVTPLVDENGKVIGGDNYFPQLFGVFPGKGFHIISGFFSYNQFNQSLNGGWIVKMKTDYTSVKPGITFNQVYGNGRGVRKKPGIVFVVFVNIAQQLNFQLPVFANRLKNQVRLVSG